MKASSRFGVQTKTHLVTLGTSTDLDSLSAPEWRADHRARHHDATFGSQRTRLDGSDPRRTALLRPCRAASTTHRLVPQYSGSGSFAGADNRMNNITFDGSYFNNSFGLAVSPVNARASPRSRSKRSSRSGEHRALRRPPATRRRRRQHRDPSGTNRITGSFYHRYRNEDFVGTGPPACPSTRARSPPRTPVLVGALHRSPFASPTREGDDTRPLSTSSQPGARRRRAHDPVDRLRPERAERVPLAAFQYETGPFRGHQRQDAGQAVPDQGRLQPQLDNR